MAECYFMVFSCSFVRWDMQSVVTLDAVDGDPNSKSHIALKRIQSPVILLYCSKDEAMWVLGSSVFVFPLLSLCRTLWNPSSKSSSTAPTSLLNSYIMEEARSLGLIGAGYIWIVSSLTTGNPDFTPEVGRLIPQQKETQFEALQLNLWCTAH